MAGCGKVCDEEEEVKQVHLLPLQGERCRGFASAGELPPNSPLIHRMDFPSLCTSELSNKAPKERKNSPTIAWSKTEIGEVGNVREGQWGICNLHLRVLSLMFFLPHWFHGWTDDASAFLLGLTRLHCVLLT